MKIRMVANYYYNFMNHFEENLSHDYFQETGSSPLVWFCFIANILYIRTSKGESMDHLIIFTKITITPRT